MRRRRLALLAVVTSLAFVAPAAAQQYTGTFTVPNDAGGVMTLSLQQGADGTVQGTLSSNGATFQVLGEVADGTLFGRMEGAQVMWFEADRSDNELWLTLYGTDANGEPNFEDYTEIDLVAQGGGGQPLAPNAQAQAGGGGLLGGGGGGGGILSGGGPSADPYVGTFSDGNLVLELQGAGGQYQGRVSVGGTVYSVTASGGPQGLQGVIQSPQGSFPMSVSATTGGVVVVEGGAQYDLARQSGAQGGILGGGAAPQPGLAQGAPQTGPGQPGAGAAQGGATSGRSGRPLAPGFTEDHPMVQEWRTYLGGKKVTRISSYSSGLDGGYSARTDVHFCSDGRFSMSEQSSVSVDVGGAFGNSGGTGGGEGTWMVITNGQVVGLILEFNSGETSEFRMDYQNGETYANGERVYVTAGELCY